MEFLWSPLLVLLLLVPLLLGLYILAQARRRRYSLRYASLALIRPAVDKRINYRRHIPPALFLIALTFMLIGLARPTAVIRAPSQEGTIILAMDSSGSMRANDLLPTRLEAAKQAARTFIEQHDASTEIGLVAFAGDTALVQPPTQDRDALYAAIDRLTYQRGTAVGSGIMASLDAIANPYDDTGNSSTSSSVPTPTPTPVPPGTFIPAAIVLLTDGRSNRGPDPIEAAQVAAERGVRVYTVGIGTKAGGLVQSQFGGGFRADLDEDSLKAIADITHAQYFYAANENDLQKIYSDLGTDLVIKFEQFELTAWFTGVGAVILLIALGLAILWLSGPL